MLFVCILFVALCLQEYLEHLKDKFENKYYKAFMSFGVYIMKITAFFCGAYCGICCAMYLEYLLIKWYNLISSLVFDR